MNNFLILLKKDLTSIVKTNKFLILIFVLVAFAVLSPVSARITQELIKLLGDDMEKLTALLGTATYIDSYIQLVGNLAEMFIFIVIILFAGSIVKEKTKGTYYVLKMNGVSKNKFVLSHLISQIICITVAYVVSLIFFFVATYILFKNAFPVHFIYGLFSLYLLLIFFIVLINFVSYFSKSPTMSMVINFSSYFSLLVFSMFGKIKCLFPFSLTENAINVLDDKITFNNNLSIITTICWCLILISVMMIFTKDKISNKKSL